MGAPISTLFPEKKKSFAASSPAEARSAASAWLNDFTQHGPLALRSIRVDGDGDEFVAVVVYKDTRIEPSPRYFETKPPFAKSA